MKHTPGPWEAENESVSAGFDMVADVFGATTEQRDANARLIAAAPDLLAALKALVGNDSVRYLDDEGPRGEGWQSNELAAAIAAADAAIAKAEGTKP
jgi:hypothetical protein